MPGFSSTRFGRGVAVLMIAITPAIGSPQPCGTQPLRVIIRARRPG